MAHVLAKELREAVLQSAVEGKLSSRHPEDSNINNLTDKLVINPKLESSQIPFDIPEHWRWVQIGNLGESIDTKSFADGPFGSNLKKAHQIESPEVRIIQLSNVGEYSWQDDNIKYTSYEHLKTIERCEVHPGDFVIAKMMPAGRTIIMPNVGTKITLGSDVVKFVPNKVLNKEYLLLAMRSNCFISQVYAEAKGITRVRTSLNKIKSYYLPIPPIEEQQRIVDRVDELIDKIDEYEKLENQLVQLKEQFPKDMRDSLLQAAIQGKLTKQLKNDTSVEEILKSIEEQKKTLIKEDKLQKKKSFHLIRNDEIPFDIPDNWVFAKLGYISTYDEAKQKINASDANDNLWMLDLEDIAKGGTLLCKKRVFERKAIGDKTIFEKGSILYSKLRPYLLKILITDEDGICTPELVPFKMYGGINTSYIALFLKSPYVDSEINKVTYGVKMPRVGTKTMVNFYVPLPPIEEQQRIVDKLDELLPLVDALAQMD